MTPPISVSEQRRLVSRWRRSDLSMVRFAESVGIPQSTFWRWTHKYADEHVVVPTRPEFIEVTAATVAEPLSVRLQAQDLPAIVLTFDRLPDAAWLGAVLRGVAAC
jgi:hypothetical protein